MPARDLCTKDYLKLPVLDSYELSDVSLSLMPEAYRLFVVLDRDYGEDLSVLAQAGPVWIVDTPLNCAAARKLWDARPNSSHLDGVTTFKFGADSSPEDIFIDELETIDLHHGIYSANLPYTVIEAIGASINEKLKGKLSEFGFNQFEVTPRGFRAHRLLPSN